MRSLDRQITTGEGKERKEGFLTYILKGFSDLLILRFQLLAMAAPVMVEQHTVGQCNGEGWELR